MLHFLIRNVWRHVHFMNCHSVSNKLNTLFTRATVKATLTSIIFGKTQYPKVFNVLLKDSFSTDAGDSFHKQKIDD